MRGVTRYDHVVTRWLRILLRVCLFVLLGAIVNVAVGWSGHQKSLSPNCRVLPFEASVAVWDEVAPSAWPTPDQPLVIEDANLVWTSWRIDSRMDSAQSLTGIYRAKCGWPRDALCGDSFFAPSGNWKSGLVHLSGTSISLPFKPIWPGFVINTVFYAVVLWPLFAGPLVLRRRRRIRRGLCPKCAYDLRGSPEDATACPECGAAATVARATQRV